MNLKELILQALNNIIRKQTMMNLNSKFIFIKVKKEVSELESLDSLETLKSLKYVKDKCYNSIVEEAGKIVSKENINEFSNIFNQRENIDHLPVDDRNENSKSKSKGHVLDENKFKLNREQEQCKLDSAKLLRERNSSNGLKEIDPQKSANVSCNYTQNLEISSKPENNMCPSNCHLNVDYDNQHSISLAISDSCIAERSSFIQENTFQSTLFENTKTDKFSNIIEPASSQSKNNNIILDLKSSLNNNNGVSHVNNNNVRLPMMDFTDAIEKIESSSDSFFTDLKSKYANISDREITTVPDQADLASISSDLSDLNQPFEVKIQSEQFKSIKEEESDSDLIVLSLPVNKHFKESDLSALDSKILSSFSDLTLDDYKNINTYKHSSYSVDSTTLSFSTSVVRPKNSKKYIPGYRTAAYAILKALYLYNGSHKHLIVLRATPFTDAEFDKTQRFSAFSAFKQLEKKNLILCNSDSKYFLTDSGLELAKMLFNNETTNIENNNEITIVVDSREKKNNRDRNYFQNYFTSRNIPNQTRFLALGDFIWIKNEKLIDFIVERKQSSDFVSSISDGRYKEQKNRLISSGLNVFYLIENLKYEPTRKNFIDRCLLEIRIQGFILLQTENIQESAFILKQIDKLVREGTKDEYIGYGSFLEESNKNKLKVNDILLISLLSVKGLCKELAVELAKKYETIQKFTNEMRKPGFDKKLFTFGINGKDIGKKVGQRIINLMS